MTSAHDSLNLPQALGDGLLLRLATPDDIEAVADFNARFLPDEDESPEPLKIWTRDLMSGQHPTTSVSDFVVVEDTNTHQIVSSMCLIPQVWVYEDIPIPVGRPELVCTDPSYRRQGLVRTAFEVIHALSGAYGHLAQGVTGIPWFYRQFDYEYALPLGGYRDLNVNDVPSLKEGETEPYQTRPPSEEDISTLMRLYQRQCAGKLVTTHIDEDWWRYDLSGRTRGSDLEYRAHLILDKEECPVGYYSTPARVHGSHLRVWELAVDAGTSLRGVLPTVLRALKAQGKAYVTAAGARPEENTFTGIRLFLGLEHPGYDILDAHLGPLRRPYAWYVRVPDVPRFIRHVAPVLERRLADSAMSGFTGELNITFYQSGLHLAFENGRLIRATDWSAPDTDERWNGAGFPPLVFLQLLFGYRSLEELRHAFPDCWADEEPRLLLNALFPKHVSWVVPLG